MSIASCSGNVVLSRASLERQENIALSPAFALKKQRLRSAWNLNPAQRPIMSAADSEVTEDESPLSINGVRSVAVIGAGVSGILASKYLRRAGLNVTVFERNSKAGGVW